MRNKESFLYDAIVNPHDGKEKFDPDFRVCYRCTHCGSVGFGPYGQIREAVTEHNNHCPVLNKKGEPRLTRLYYPRSS